MASPYRKLTRHPSRDSCVSIAMPATIYPFLLLGLLYVFMGGKVAIAIPIFAVFVVVHSIVYLNAMQPCRSIAFAVSLLAIVGLMSAIVENLLTA
jgi:prostaglandin-E synthase 1